MFTWCALDAIMMPGVIDATARVESQCYVTGYPIQLTVTPDGVTDYSPDTTVCRFLSLDYLRLNQSVAFR